MLLTFQDTLWRHCQCGSMCMLDPFKLQMFECVNVLVHLENLLDVGVQMWTNRIMHFIHTGECVCNFTHILLSQIFIPNTCSLQRFPSAHYNRVKGWLYKHFDMMHLYKMFGFFFFLSLYKNGHSLFWFLALQPGMFSFGPPLPTHLFLF